MAGYGHAVSASEVVGWANCLTQSVPLPLSSEVSEPLLPLHGQSLAHLEFAPSNSTVAIPSGIHTSVCEESTVMLVSGNQHF